MASLATLRSRLPKGQLRPWTFALICICGHGLLSSSAGAQLTEEDLLEAFERGELTRDEFEELVDRFRGCAAQDAASPLLPADSIRTAEQLKRLTAGVGPASPAGLSAAHEVLIRLRGTGDGRERWALGVRQRRWALQGELVRREPGGWRVRQGEGQTAFGPLRITLGAFERRWTGGLLIGAAPPFLRPYNRLGPTLRYPERGRLCGVGCTAALHGAELEGIASLRRDPAYEHGVWGARVGVLERGVQIECALLHQWLARLNSAQRFRTTIGGVTAAHRGAADRKELAAAFGSDGLAAQGSVELEPRAGCAVRLSAWEVSPGFRHPLLHAAGEPDREQVSYPELDRTLASASSGERGGEMLLRIGSSRRRTELSWTYWRERPGRPASVRAGVARAQRSAAAGWRIAYLLRSGPIEMQRAERHEWRLEWTRRPVWVAARLTHGESAPPYGAMGGRLEVQLQSAPARADRGSVTLRVAYDDYDFARDRSAFWTVRLDQFFLLGRGTRLALHLRWRTAYRGEGRSLSARALTEIAL